MEVEAVAEATATEEPRVEVVQAEQVPKDVGVVGLAEAVARDEVVQQAEAVAVRHEEVAAPDWGKCKSLVKDCVEWLRQCSKHLHHIEVRPMGSQLLGHEVVRQLVQSGDLFCARTHG